MVVSEYGMQRAENVSENVQHGSRGCDYGTPRSNSFPNSNVLAAAQGQSSPRDENYDDQLERLRNFLVGPILG